MAKSYAGFLESMRVVSRQADLMNTNHAPHYKRLMEILSTCSDANSAEKAVWAEFDATHDAFFRAKAYDLNALQS